VGFVARFRIERGAAMPAGFAAGVPGLLERDRRVLCSAAVVAGAHGRVLPRCRNASAGAAESRRTNRGKLLIRGGLPTDPPAHRVPFRWISRGFHVRAGMPFACGREWRTSASSHLDV